MPPKKNKKKEVEAEDKNSENQTSPEKINSKRAAADSGEEEP